MSVLNASNSEERYSVPALERGLSLLMEFSRHSPKLTAPELARRLDLPRTSVFRMLNTLEQLGFVDRIEGGHTFKLGIAVLRLGFDYLSSLDLTELSKPILGKLRDKIGYACNLVIRDKRSIVYIAKVEPTSWIASTVTVGTRLPAHATVFGRLLCADMTLEQLEALFPDEMLESYTSQTPKTAQELFQLIQRDKQHPCVVGEGFFESSISTVGAVVRNEKGVVVAALGATVPYRTIAADLREMLIGNIQQAASELSTALGYSAPRLQAEPAAHP